MLAHRGVLYEEATAAASEVIRASTERTAAAAARLSKGKATVRRNVLHSPVDLLAQHAAKVAAEAARVADRANKEAEKESERVKKAAEVVRKAAAKENITCRACAKTTRRRGGLGRVPLWGLVGVPCMPKGGYGWSKPWGAP